ncbi:hypothetical protein MMC10_008690 [Thelotrema lepadinum]|nr:hypothetical protein [Thelotrema lepadinum]
MGDIYRHATSTIIWLGLRDDEVEALAYLVGVIESTTYLSDIPNPDSPFHDVRFIPCGWLDEDSSYRRARRRDDRDEKLLRLFKHFLFPNWSDFHSSFRRNPSFLDSAMITTDEKRLLLALSHPVIIKLHLADYWKRAWIVQEIGLSLELFILTPRRRIPFDNFLHRLLLLHFQHFQTLSHVLNFKLLNDIWVNHRYWFKHRPYSVFAGCYSDHKVDLLYALDFVRGRKCTDLRDRAYSILSLVKHGEDFPIDYSTKPTGLFWQLVRFIARHGVDGDFDGFEDRWVHGDILPGGSPKSLYVAATEDELDTGFDMRDLSLAAGMAFEILQLKTVFILGPNIHELSELTANFETLTSQYYWVRGPLPEEYKFSELGREITAERKMLWLCIPLRLAQKPALLMWTRDHLVTYNTKFGCKTGAGLYRKDSAWRVIETYHSPDYSFRGQFMR